MTYDALVRSCDTKNNKNLPHSVSVHENTDFSRKIIFLIFVGTITDVYTFDALTLIFP